ncbi:hypothetical protein BDV93DRAFT_559876 [Ceratobasidium sp. AG-I]|nr:hypothetical protein BDV93DRAFT_559876 [Ceratobasidium sp. AG-I]
MPRPVVGPRLIGRINSEGVATPNREEAKYGTVDKLFNIFFCEDHHMVKPQPPLRAELAELDFDTSFDPANASLVANASISSDTSVLSTDTYGEYVGPGNPVFPDFIVCEYSTSGTQDKPILVIEMKRDEWNLTKAVDEVIEYLQFMGKRALGDVPTHGLAIAGNRVVIFVPDSASPTGFRRMSNMPPRLSLTDEWFFDYLYERACLAPQL